MNIVVHEGHPCINHSTLTEVLGVAIAAKSITEKTSIAPHGDKAKASVMWKVADVTRICDGMAAYFDKVAVAFVKTRTASGG